MIVKSIQCTFNEKLSDLEYNEIKMREVLSQLWTYIATFGSQIENTTYLLSLKITVENHIVKALDASHTVKLTLNILVDCIAEVPKGTLPPRVMSPALIMENLRSSIPYFPADTTLPFPLGKDYLFLMYQLNKFSVYTYRKRLG